MTKVHKVYDRQEDVGAYLPTQEEIAAKTAAIRATWNEREKKVKLNSNYQSGPVTISTVKQPVLKKGLG